MRKVTDSRPSAADAELFRAQMLTEMARMSLDDGLVMQIHPGSFRNHNRALFASHGRDKGADIPTATDYVHALKPLLERFGNEPRLTLIVFTLDESAYSRELAPLAGHYPALRLGPAWWFHDSPKACGGSANRPRRRPASTTPSASTTTRARSCRSRPVTTSRGASIAPTSRGWCSSTASAKTEALEVAADLAYHLPKRAYRLG